MKFPKMSSINIGHGKSVPCEKALSLLQGHCVDIQKRITELVTTDIIEMAEEVKKDIEEEVERTEKEGEEQR